jgi:hypothetical protein
MQRNEKCKVGCAFGYFAASRQHKTWNNQHFGYPPYLLTEKTNYRPPFHGQDVEYECKKVNFIFHKLQPVNDDVECYPVQCFDSHWEAAGSSGWSTRKYAYGLWFDSSGLNTNAETAGVRWHSWPRSGH